MLHRSTLPTLLLLGSLSIACGDDGDGGGGAGAGPAGGGAEGAGGASGDCGNGVLDAGEACDGDDLGDKTCEEQGFASGALACDASCALDTSACVASSCGNGVADDGEDCDGNDLAGNTCQTAGFPGGVIDCSPECTLDTQQCETETECGNGLIEGIELCDSSDLGGETCASQGFASGTLLCSTECDFDTSACSTCGDDAIDTGEDCDGSALGGETCVLLGFDTGTLACASDCSFDESGCDFFSCGNATLEPGEDCDGSLLGGGTCIGEGFDGGTISCAGNCTYDTDSCTTCGDNLIEGTEACDGTALGGQTCQGLGFVSGNLSCSASCAFVTTACSNVPLPGSGNVVITEIMQNPSGTDNVTGEWIELYNPSGTTTYQLGGCVVEGDLPTESFTIAGSLLIGPLARVTLANVAAPGFAPSYVYSGVTLTNGADAVRLRCNSVLVDEVEYDGGPVFPDPDGASMSLSPGFDATTNDVGANWCAATTASPGFTSGDFGSPGQPNETCALDYTVGFCRLQFPTTINEVQGTSVTVFGRVYAMGLTDQTNGNDPAVNLIGQVGYGPDGTDPAVTMWTWTAAIPNPGWNGASAGEPNNDEYQAALAVPVSSGSPYDYAYRFSGDGGTTWVYCDGDAAGSSNGYALANAGQMTSTPGAPPNVWINEIHYDNASTDLDEGVEIAGPAGTDLTGFSVRAYNGSDGTSYLTSNLSGTIPNQMNGFGTVWVPMVGLQNGAPDGIALIGTANQVIQFLCYEGTFAATNGPAVGQTCTNIGVSQEPPTAIGLALQLTGTGGAYSAFTWAAASAHSRGLVNVGQTLQ